MESSMDLPTALAICSGVAGVVGTFSIVISKFAPRKSSPIAHVPLVDGRVPPCLEHTEVKTAVQETKADVTTIKRVVFRIARFNNIPVQDYEDLVQ